VIGDVLCVFSRSLSLLLLRASAKLALPVWSCDAFGMLWPGRISRADKPKVFPSLHSKLGPDSQKRIVGQWDFERLGCRWDWHTQSSIHTLFFSFIFFFSFLSLWFPPLFFGWGPSYFLGRGIELCIPLSFSLVCSCFCKSNRTAYCSGPGYSQVKQSKAKEEKHDETTTSESQSRNFKNREREREKKARKTKIVKRPYRLFYLSLSLNFFFFFPPSFERRCWVFCFYYFPSLPNLKISTFKRERMSTATTA
jgi:hypothetical protein